MADQEVKRPTGLIPSFSNDDNLDDVGEAWDATPTKVEPGAGKRDDGFLPDEDIDAQHVNHMFNEIGKWIQFFSDIQIQNWMLPYEVPDLAGGLECDGAAVVWDDGSRNWRLIGKPDGQSNMLSARSFNGTDWFDYQSGAILLAGNNAGITDGFAFSKPSEDTPTHNGAFVVTGGESQICVDENSVWTVYAINGQDDTALCGVWDPSNELCLVGGHDDSGPPVEPAFHSSPADVISWTRNKPSLANSEEVVDMATDGAGLTLAIGDQTDGDTWTSTDGLAWTLRTTTIDDMRACAYNAEEALWMIVDGTGRTHTSVDAINWSLASGPQTVISAPRCLRAQGSLYVYVDETEGSIAFSTDSGASWRQTYPAQNNNSAFGSQTNNNWKSISYSGNQRRFMISTDKGGEGSNAVVNQSLSVGTLGRNAAGSNNDVPTVT